MHIRDALADEFVGLGFIEERESILQRHVGKFCKTLYYATVLHAEEGWISLHRSLILQFQQNAGACQSVVDCTSKSANWVSSCEVKISTRETDVWMLNASVGCR